jgi:hypothetical protein
MADVTVSGPFFDGRDHAVLDAMCEDIARTVANEGAIIMDAYLETVIRHPSDPPFYQQHVGVSPGATLLDRDIDDGGIVYGPWLNGTGSRNRTTRFKGYSHFRITTQRLEANASRIAQHVVGPYVARM